LSIADEIGILIGQMSSDQATTRENLSGDEAGGQLTIFSSERIILTGDTELVSLGLGSSSFVIDHPVYGDIDSSVLHIDGGYGGGTSTLFEGTF